MKVRLKHTHFEALQWDGSNLKEMRAHCGLTGLKQDHTFIVQRPDKSESIAVITDWVVVTPGDRKNGQVITDFTFRKEFEEYK